MSDDPVILLVPKWDPYGLDVPESIVLDEKGNPSHGLLALWLEGKYRWAAYEDTGELLVFDESSGIYTPGQILVARKAEAMFGEKTTSYFVGETIDHLVRRSYRPREGFGKAPGVVVANGVLSAETGDLPPFDPERYDISRIPVAYDPDADCPRFKEFLAQVVRPQDVPLLQEAFGYSLMKGYPYHVAILLYGPGRNGKGTLLRILRALLGKGNASSVTLQDIARGSFRLAELFGKMANIAGDLQAKTIPDAGYFKMATGEDEITAERKYGHPFTFRNEAKMWFSANRIPPSGDDSDAFYARWRIVTFPNRFYGENETPQLDRRIIEAGELPGILNWALEGHRRLVENDGFTQTPAIPDVRDTYIAFSDPVAAWLEASCLKDPEGVVAKGDAYEHFLAFAAERGLPTMDLSVFVKDVNRVATWVRQGQKRELGRVWYGFILFDPEEGG